MSKANREKRTSVRGNTAKYTPEKPLFGKYVGSVYRPEHERGVPESSTTDKDLEVIRLETPKSIYLAGKISHGDWRHGIVKNLREQFSGDCSGEICSGGYLHKNGNTWVPGRAPDEWPVLPNAVFGLDYTGPYFVSDDHGCCHGDDSHGAAADHDGLYDGPHNSDPRRGNVIKWCLDAIWRSDIVFAWIDDTTCYGTLAEIGYAKALEKIILIAGTNRQWEHTDLWFACNMANETLFEEWLTPAIAIQIFMAKQLHTLEAIRAMFTASGSKITIDGR